MAHLLPCRQRGCYHVCYMGYRQLLAQDANQIEGVTKNELGKYASGGDCPAGAIILVFKIY